MADGKVKEPEHAKIDEIVEEDDEFEEFEDEVRSAPDAQLLLYTRISAPAGNEGFARVGWRAGLALSPVRAYCLCVLF